MKLCDPGIENSINNKKIEQGKITRSSPYNKTKAFQTFVANKSTQIQLHTTDTFTNINKKNNNGRYRKQRVKI